MLRNYSAPEASWRRVFDPCTSLLFDLYHYLEQNGYLWLVPEHDPGPSSQVLPGCRVRHPCYSKKLFVRCVHKSSCVTFPVNVWTFTQLPLSAGSAGKQGAKTLHTTTHCNTLQHTATHKCYATACVRRRGWKTRSQNATTHCSILQHIAIHCNTLQHTTTHKYYATTCVRRRGWKTRSQNATTHCDTLQHTATHCSTLQYTAIHKCYANTRVRRRGWKTRSQNLYNPCMDLCGKRSSCNGLM